MPIFFEDMVVGQIHVSPRRTITETDIVQFAGLTGDYNPIHTAAVFAAASNFGQRIAHGPMLVGMAFGLLPGCDCSTEQPWRCSNRLDISGRREALRYDPRAGDHRRCPA